MACYKLGELSQIPPGEGRTFVTGAHRIAVFRSRDGCIYATQAECPHKRGPLADGLLGGATLVCPLHDWSFDLKTGRALNAEGQLRVYAVETDADGTLSVEIAEFPGATLP